MKQNELELLEAYRSIWNQRTLNLQGDPGTILKESIIRELQDENSHPRIRKSKEVKYYFGVKRIIESALEVERKYDLIKLYTDQLEKLRNT
ncbi:hypothetical protein V1502_12875 [Bacillus sp. SCS-153A]|uniref:hypothetical protein n=1 Tax=Rossellomorea sedimentorum TaxID=3115294 RepID=UPI0039059D6A